MTKQGWAALCGSKANERTCGSCVAKLNQGLSGGPRILAEVGFVRSAEDLAPQISGTELGRYSSATNVILDDEEMRSAEVEQTGNHASGVKNMRRKARTSRQSALQWGGRS